MSPRSVAMLPSFHLNQGLWCKVNIRLGSRLPHWLDLPIIFNIFNGYTNSSNKISTTYTAQKQILLSPKNTNMLLGRGRLLIFIGCIWLSSCLNDHKADDLLNVDGTASFSISHRDFLLPPMYGEGNLAWFVSAGTGGMRMRAGLWDTYVYWVVWARLSKTGPDCSVLVPKLTVPGVALIWMSNLSFLPRYLIMSCSSVDCQALSFRLCSEMAVSDLVVHESFTQQFRLSLWVSQWTW